MKYTQFNTRLGEIIVVGDKAGITELFINNNTKAIHLPADCERDDACFAEARDQLTDYAAGKRSDFSLPLNPKGTDFQQRCWQALQAIPSGETRTYGEVAKSIGHTKASRAVGLANNRNPIPILIPCHRVIGANGKLTGYAYGLPLKQQLIDLEKNAITR